MRLSNMKRLFLIVLASTALLNGCSSTSEKPEKEEQLKPVLTWHDEQNELDGQFVEQLLPPIDELSQDVQRFDIRANRTPIRAFLMSLVEGTEYNLVLHQKVKGNISLKLNQVTVIEVLQAVRDIYGYGYKQTNYGIHILPKTQQTKIFHVNYLNVTRQGESGMSISNGQVGSSHNSNTTSSSSSYNNGTNSNTTNNTRVSSAKVETTTKTDFWKQLELTLKLMAENEDQAKIVVDPQSGMVIVRALPNLIRDVQDYLERAELVVQKQVLIEAKILEVSLNEGFESGIRWDTFGAGRNAQVSDTKRDVVASLSSEFLFNKEGGIFGLNFDLQDFTGVIEALEKQGDVKVLSSPRITTVNNQKAVIKVGSDEFYVTEIKSNTTTTTTGTTNSPEIVLTPFFSGIALDVTPQIGDENEVILHVHPTVTEVAEQNKRVDLSGDEYNLPLAVSTVRETDSIIKAISGQVVVIGGLMQNQKRVTNAGVPFLRDIPLLGWLFNQKRESMVQSELIILIQPRIVDEKFNRAEYERINRKFSELGNYQ